MGGSDELCGKGTELSLFLFSDVLEISKKRTKSNPGLGLMARSPSAMSLKASTLSRDQGNANANSSLGK